VSTGVCKRVWVCFLCTFICAYNWVCVIHIKAL